jgi:hypothetical protein
LTDKVLPNIMCGHHLIKELLLIALLFMTGQNGIVLAGDDSVMTKVSGRPYVELQPISSLKGPTIGDCSQSLGLPVYDKPLGFLTEPINLGGTSNGPLDSQTIYARSESPLESPITLNAHSAVSPHESLPDGANSDGLLFIPLTLKSLQCMPSQQPSQINTSSQINAFSQFCVSPVGDNPHGSLSDSVGINADFNGSLFGSLTIPARSRAPIFGPSPLDEDSPLLKPLPLSINSDQLSPEISIAKSPRRDRWQIDIDDFPPINEQQRKIFKKISHDPDKYTYFINPDQYKIIGGNDVLPKGSVPKTWTMVERTKINQVISAVLQRLPGLFTTATSGNKIALCRIFNEDYRSREVILSSKPGMIFVPDAFFETSSFRCKYFAHELLHLSDVACQRSLSREWVKFANPTIYKIRQQSKLYSPEDLDSIIRKSNVWPDLNGCTNLEESFAWYFTEYLFPTDFKFDLKEIRRFDYCFMQPQPREKLFIMHSTRGYLALVTKNLGSARSEFLAAQKLSPLVGRVYLGLAGTYYHTRRSTEISLAYCNKACEIFRRDGVPRDDYYFALALRCRDRAAQKLSATTVYRPKVRVDAQHRTRSTHGTRSGGPKPNVPP